MSRLPRLLDVKFQHAGQTRPLLDGIHLTLQPGDAMAWMGPSGSGKSTLLAILAGLLRPTSGSLRMGEHDLHQLGDAELDRYRSEILGLMFQSPCLLPHLSLLDNVLMPAEHLPKGVAPWRERAHWLLAQAGLSGLEQRFPHQVSGGQAQRASACRALLRRPALMLADEPTASLDAEAAQRLMDLLLAMRDEGMALVVVTHDAKVAAQLPRQCRLEAGRLVDAPALAAV